MGRYAVRNGPVHSTQRADTQYAMGGTQYVERNGRYAMHSTQYAGTQCAVHNEPVRGAQYVMGRIAVRSTH